MIIIRINIRFLAMASALLLSSCSPRVTSYVSSPYDPLPRWEEVSALPKGAEVPVGAERLGEVMVGTAHFVPASQGTLEKEQELVKKAARLGGGNLYQITEIREPDEKHRLNRIKADVYRYPFADSLGVTVPRALLGLRNYWVLSFQGGWSYWANKPEGIKDDDNSFRPLYTWGRPLTVTHKLDADDSVVLHNYAYDAVGRLESDSRNGDADLRTNYTYNVRSWLTDIKVGGNAQQGTLGETFTEKLYYQTLRPVNPQPGVQWGGNVNAMDWMAGSDGVGRFFEKSFRFHNE